MVDDLASQFLMMILDFVAAATSSSPFALFRANAALSRLATPGATDKRLAKALWLFQRDLEQADEIPGGILIVDRKIARQVSPKYCGAMKVGRRNPKCVSPAARSKRYHSPKLYRCCDVRM
jgi:hypothetical protein